MAVQMTSFVLGTTIIAELEVRNASGTLVDPSTSVKWTVKDPDGTTVVSDQEMTKDATGQYHGDYTPTSKKGKYAIWGKATNGSRVTVAYCTAIVV